MAAPECILYFYTVLVVYYIRYIPFDRKNAIHRKTLVGISWVFYRYFYYFKLLEELICAFCAQHYYSHPILVLNFEQVHRFSRPNSKYESKIDQTRKIASCIVCLNSEFALYTYNGFYNDIVIRTRKFVCFFYYFYPYCVVRV